MMTRLAPRAACPFLLCLALAAPAAAQVQQRQQPAAKPPQSAAKSADRSFSGCLQGIDHVLEADGRIGVMIHFAGAPGPVSLQPQGMVFTGASGKLTLAQLGDWAPLLDALRDAGRSKNRVSAQIDFNTNKVEGININYTQGC